CLLAAVCDFVLMAVRITTGLCSSSGCHSRDYHSSLLRGKGPVAAVPGADTVGSYNSEMIGSLRTQSRDCRTDILVIVPSVGLVGRSVSIIGGSSILEIMARGQPMRIEQAIEPRSKSHYGDGGGRFF